MTVIELISLLSKFPPAARAVVDGFESGLEDVINADTVNIRADVNLNLDADHYDRHLVDTTHPAESAVWLKSARARGAMFAVQDMERLKEQGLW